MHNNCDKFRITPEFIPRVQNMARFQTDCPVYFVKNKTNNYTQTNIIQTAKPKIYQ